MKTAKLIQVVPHHNRPNEEHVIAQSHAPNEGQQYSELVTKWGNMTSVVSGLSSRVVIRYASGRESVLAILYAN